jgi:hypothetical protein
MRKKWSGEMTHWQNDLAPKLFYILPSSNLPNGHSFKNCEHNFLQQISQKLLDGEQSQGKYTPKAGKSEQRGRLSTVRLLIKLACSAKKMSLVIVRYLWVKPGKPY